MKPETVETRVVRIERRMTRLEELPARVDALTSQILQFRREMHGEFSAVRGEMQELGLSLRREMRTMNEQTLAQMRGLFEELVGRIALTREGSSEPPRRRQKK